MAFLHETSGLLFPTMVYDASHQYSLIRVGINISHHHLCIIYADVSSKYAFVDVIVILKIQAWHVPTSVLR